MNSIAESKRLRKHYRNHMSVETRAWLSRRCDGAAKAFRMTETASVARAPKECTLANGEDPSPELDGDRSAEDLERVAVSIRWKLVFVLGV